METYREMKFKTKVIAPKETEKIGFFDTGENYQLYKKATLQKGITGHNYFEGCGWCPKELIGKTVEVIESVENILCNATFYEVIFEGKKFVIPSFFFQKINKNHFDIE